MVNKGSFPFHMFLLKPDDAKHEICREGHHYKLSITENEFKLLYIFQLKKSTSVNLSECFKASGKLNLILQRPSLIGIVDW